ncbi:hypothetical protein CQW23_32449 [Capsicum baccatum]|uniref:Uncharacterized protein n=1 Tax=Capsicum baccatum TaxID=33114 RepID=A0A2G2V4N3_CAPBA|nr:hypothetical protein CQW23_32449 [Capsicum baccatum]
MIQEAWQLTWPYFPYEKAFGDALEAFLHRHIVPEPILKLQKWLRIVREKKLIQACEALDQFIYPCISRKLEELLHKSTIKDEEFTFLNAYIKMYNQWKDGDLGTLQSFLRDTFLNLMFAGRDTTSAALTWFFVLLAKNPSVEKKIRQEIQQQLYVKEDENLKLFTKEESRKLIYLHGSLCETLRLFPSLPLEHKVPLDHDILPSGHHVSPNTRMILPFYSMGRMDTLWGKDCLEFKPERWISDRGGIKHEPSFKFPAFNVGPRTCIGKEMEFFQMKIVAATIIHNYHIQVVEPNNVSRTTSIIMQVKNALMVKIVVPQDCKHCVMPRVYSWDITNLVSEPKNMPSKKNKRRTGNQPSPQPVQADPLDEHVSYVEFRAAFTTLANFVETQNKRLTAVRPTLWPILLQLEFKTLPE